MIKQVEVNEKPNKPVVKTKMLVELKDQLKCYSLQPGLYIAGATNLNTGTHYAIYTIDQVFKGNFKVKHFKVLEIYENGLPGDFDKRVESLLQKGKERSKGRIAILSTSNINIPKDVQTSHSEEKKQELEDASASVSNEIVQATIFGSVEPVFEQVEPKPKKVRKQVAADPVEDIQIDGQTNLFDFLEGGNEIG
jgi:hypothetical protein